MKHQEILITCMPIDMLDDPVAGSIQIDGSCGHRIWISPSMVAITQSNPQAQTQCVRCTLISGLKTKDGMSMTPAQRQELNGILGVAEVDQIVARFQITEVDV